MMSTDLDTTTTDALILIQNRPADDSSPHDGSALASTDTSEAELLERRRNFGAWLRECRRKARVTQAELAKLLGYDSSQLISNIERGVSLLPSKKIPEIARVLGCSLVEMEVRYFQCSAKNTAESRMPDLLLKYLPMIEILEYGSTDERALLEAIRAFRLGTSGQP